MLKLLFAGPLRQGSTALMRCEAFRSLGLDVRQVDYSPFCEEGSRVLRAIERRVTFGTGIWKLNRYLQDESRHFKPDLIWVEKAIYLWPSTITKLAVPVVHYSPDPYFRNGTHQSLIIRSLPRYAAVLTTKTFNLADLMQCGARRAHYVGNAFDPETHRPVLLSALERTLIGTDVCFIGRWEPDREETLAKLAKAGVAVRVWGRDWAARGLPSALRSCIVPNGVWGDDYARVISAAKISVNILSKWACDDETTRSMEIPACGGFMLAERTGKHLEYFTEGQEAEFYTGFSELREKVRIYLADDKLRAQVAQAGYKRCIRSGYSYRDRMASVLAYLESEGLVTVRGSGINTSSRQKRDTVEVHNGKSLPRHPSAPGCRS